MKNTRQLTEGAVLLAAFAIILLLTLYVPFLGAIIIFFLPLPFILFTAKYNFKGILVFLAAAVVISIIISGIWGIVYLLLFGATGAVMGYLIQKNKSRPFILLISTLTFLLSTVALYAISVGVFHMNFIQQFNDSVNESLKITTRVLKGMGKGSKVDKVTKQYKEMIVAIKTIFPSLLVLSSLFTVYILQLINFPILKRLGITISAGKPFRELTLPRSLLWYYIIAMGANLIFHPDAGTYWHAVVINLFYVLSILMFLQGLFVLYYLFHKRSISKGFQIIVTILIFMAPKFLYVVSLLGIMDLGFDFRKRRENKQ